MVPCCSGGRTFPGQKNKQVREKSNLPSVTASCSGKGKMPSSSCSNLGRARREEFRASQRWSAGQHHTAWDSPAKHSLGFPRNAQIPRAMDAALKSRAEGRKHSMDISLSSKRSWSTAGYHPALTGFGKMLQLCTWLTHYRLLLSNAQCSFSKLY